MNELCFIGILICIWVLYRIDRTREVGFWVNVTADLRKKYDALVMETACCPSEKKQYEAAITRARNLEWEIRTRVDEKIKLKRQLASAKGQITKLKKQVALLKGTP